MKQFSSLVYSVGYRGSGWRYAKDVCFQNAGINFLTGITKKPKTTTTKKKQPKDLEQYTAGSKLTYHDSM